ncbi:MAG: transcription antitermination factor NusB [Rubrivivax sp.]|nr:transcription antitermination factor NusB [Rubrivivax sp.]
MSDPQAPAAVASVDNKPAAAADAPLPAKAAAKRTGPKSARRRSREFAMQGLYRWLVAGGDGAAAEADVRELDGFDKCDRAHFDALLHGGIEQAAALDTVLVRHVDRKTSLLSPVEHAVLMIGVYELMHCVEIPYRVAINEAVELAKSFGGTDGHKYVNGVLDKCAADLRPNEARPVRR